MTENKRFVIDLEETHQKNAIWEFNKSIDDYQFVCWEDDCNSLVGKLNDLHGKNEELKQQIENMAFILRQNGLGLMEDDD